MTYEEMLKRKEKAIKRRKRRKAIRNGLIYLTLILSIVLYILASFQLSLANPQGLIAMLVSGGFILWFWSVNCDE